ncbi:DUF5677 domain-containing protein [Tunturiibacter psychrotolerans]|uniref:DUF5677 domain-containing protein n=1 Tax=Tunturiibacter psychrotolerans TaxID=3069686 RepID=UPI003D1C09E8
MADRDPDEQYLKVLKSFRKLSREARWALFQAQGLAGGERRHWSSVLQIRICLISESIEHLCPDESSPEAAKHWDFSSIASLSRNLFEAVAFFNYISTPVSPEVFTFRVLLMEYNDCMNRLRIFRQMDMHDQITRGEVEAATFQSQLTDDNHFRTLDPHQQKRAMTGLYPTLISLREMAGRVGQKAETWGIYDYLSTHSHTLPVSFFRITTQSRTGKENESEKALLTGTLEMLVELVDESVTFYRNDHAEFVSFKPLL